jgi:hypothetical protein
MPRVLPDRGTITFAVALSGPGALTVSEPYSTADQTAAGGAALGTHKAVTVTCHRLSLSPLAIS